MYVIIYVIILWYRSPLMLAGEAGHATVVSLLLENMAHYIYIYIEREREIDR